MSGLFFYLCVVICPPTASNMPKEQQNMQADEKAFRELIGRQRDLIWALCRTYRLGAAWDTEDAFHEVLVALWQGFGSYGGRSSERTWVYRVAVNTLNSLLRRLGNQPAPEMRSHSEERLPKEGEEVSAAYMKSCFVDTVPTEDASVGDLFVDIMDSLIRVSVDTAYSITRTEHWDNGVLVDSTCDTGSSPFTTHQSSLTGDAIFQAARAHGDAGYLAYTDSESLALWLFFYADRQGMVHVINTIVNR